jgi:hypothetical protein
MKVAVQAKELVVGDKFDGMTVREAVRDNKGNILLRVVFEDKTFCVKANDTIEIEQRKDATASDLSPVISALSILRDFNTGRIKESLVSLPETIRAQKSLVTTARQALKDVEALLGEREAAVRFEISTEANEGGKAKYSNAEQRSAELTTRKGKDPEYLQLQGNARQAQRALDDATAEYEALEHKFQAYGSVSELVGAEIKLYAKLGVDGPRPDRPRPSSSQPF